MGNPANTYFTTVIQPEELSALMGEKHCRIVDCRFRLADTGAGKGAYLKGHIPGSVYAHLDEVLSNPRATDNGRHPLPPPDVLVERFADLGIGPDTQVIAYDAAGAMIAPRLWWLLKYMGHKNAAVLNGGIKGWMDAGYDTVPGAEKVPGSDFHGHIHPEMFITADQLAAMKLVVDSRSPERYSGETEPIDPKAGHIPGAVSFPFASVMDEAGYFLEPEILKAMFTRLLDGTSPMDSAFYCGSGVTACVNLFAMTYAGLDTARLYAGSWSDWISDPRRAIAEGTAP